MNGKNRSRKRIFIVGTNHISRKSKEKIEEVTERHEFDCYLCEGVRENPSPIELLKRDPLLFLPLKTYFWFLGHCGKDLRTLAQIAKKKGVPCINVDMELTEIIRKGRRWYDYLWIAPLVFPMFYVASLGISLFTVSLTAILFFCVELCYFGYFVLKTKEMRDAAFVTNTKKALKNESYKKALLVCGSLHVENVAKMLRESGFQVHAIR